MITKWSLSNFKSIDKETTLDLTPLTIFAGPNSSGKSSIIQSLLLVSQTLSHKVSSRSVVLNGSLARLGQYDDLRSYGGEFDHITLGWECHPNEGTQMTIIENMAPMGSLVIHGQRIDTIKEITCKLSFDTNPGSPDRDLYQLQPKFFLFTMSLLVLTEDNIDRRYDLTITRSSDGMAKISNLKLQEPANENALSSLEYDIVLDDKSLDELREELITAEPVGCILQHFLPEKLFIRINVIDEIARQLSMILTEDTPKSRRIPAFFNRELAIPESLIKLIQNKLGDKVPQLFENQQNLFEIGGGISIREWFERTRKLSPEKRRELRRIMNEWTDLQPTITQLLRSERKENQSEYQLLSIRLPMDLWNASAFLGTFFSNSVKYLGPLRDEPKPLYPLAAHADPTDVGLRGEMTAAVLNLHRDRKIKYIPSSVYTKTPFEPIPVIRSLEVAVNDWLKYLGVAETAHSFDKGKLGHELKVSVVENGPQHDLTHVGVGVSQVLPILIMSLLSNGDNTLIFEQPELHLHPMVQTRLADFFLSVVLTGKQCLIETHSEYLINRLRFRAASEGEGNRITNNLKIYFVEKTHGSSTFREVRVNEYGAILDWPEGFFDQTSRESEDILRAAMTKKQRLKNNKEKNNA